MDDFTPVRIGPALHRLRDAPKGTTIKYKTGLKEMAFDEFPTAAAAEKWNAALAEEVLTGVRQHYLVTIRKQANVGKTARWTMIDFSPWAEES